MLVCAQVDVKMYLVFPKKSDGTVKGRLIGDSINAETELVKTRKNSPSDDVLFFRPDVTYELRPLRENVYVSKYIGAGQIKPKPNQQQSLDGIYGTVRWSCMAPITCILECQPCMRILLS